MVKTAPSTAIGSDRHLVNDYLANLLRAQRPADGGCVHDAMSYSVLGAGQRVRPILALAVARLLGVDCASVLRAAAAVELFHCASLIIDDLPCMDDASTRRGEPTVHIRYGEANAVLAAFGLVALAARSLAEGPVEDRSRLLAFQLHLLKALDCSALIAGQALDLHLTGDRREQQRLRVTELKTVPLFQLAVQAGALFADLSPVESVALREFGTAFGTAFQTADDYIDGECFDLTELESQLATARGCLVPFGGAASELEGLLSYLHGRAQQQPQNHCHR